MTFCINREISAVLTPPSPPLPPPSPIIIQECTVHTVLYFFFDTDLNLKILKDDSACPGACQVIQW